MEPETGYGASWSPRQSVNTLATITITQLAAAHVVATSIHLPAAQELPSSTDHLATLVYMLHRRLRGGLRLLGHDHATPMMLHRPAVQ